MRISHSTQPPSPWHSFLQELDNAVDTTVRMDCIGGFIVTQLYGLARTTADLDVVELAPTETSKHENLLEHPDEAFAFYRKEGIANVICD